MKQFSYNRFYQLGLGVNHLLLGVNNLLLVFLGLYLERV